MRVLFAAGTGACAVYPLLGSRRGWKMVATERDQDSLVSARQNVERNGLQQQIQGESGRADRSDGRCRVTRLVCQWETHVASIGEVSGWLCTRRLGHARHNHDVATILYKISCKTSFCPGDIGNVAHRRTATRERLDELVSVRSSDSDYDLCVHYFVVGLGVAKLLTTGDSSIATTSLVAKVTFGELFTLTLVL